MPKACRGTSAQKTQREGSHPDIRATTATQILDVGADVVARRCLQTTRFQRTAASTQAVKRRRNIPLPWVASLQGTGPMEEPRHHTASGKAMTAAAKRASRTLRPPAVCRVEVDVLFVELHAPPLPLMGLIAATFMKIRPMPEL